MKKNRVRSLLALGLSLTMMVSIMGCGKQQRLDAEINPDTPVSDVQFPLKETEELSFITSAPATSTQDPNKRVIFQRMEEQTNVHIDWTCFVSDQFSDKKKLNENLNSGFGPNARVNGDADKILDQLRVRRFICILTKTASVL